MLDKATFLHVLEHAPLLSLDLLVESPRGEYLLGLRKNRPAQGYWFVPGGRVFKGESLAQAFERLTSTELGINIRLENARHHGLYEHFYSDNVFADESGYSHISTHYIVNAFRIVLPTTISLPAQQHSQWRWVSPARLLQDSSVHQHTKWYFQ